MFCEFAVMIQAMIRRGWELIPTNEGTRLVLRRGDEEHAFESESEVMSWWTEQCFITSNAQWLND